MRVARLNASAKVYARWPPAVSRGGPPRGRRARQAPGRDQWPWLLADTAEAAVDAFFGPYAEVMSRIGRERGWPLLSGAQFDQGRGPRGHLMVGTPDGRHCQNPRSARGFSSRPALSCRCPFAPSRGRRSCARSSFLARSSRPRCARSSRNGRSRLKNG